MTGATDTAAAAAGAGQGRGDGAGAGWRRAAPWAPAVVAAAVALATPAALGNFGLLAPLGLLAAAAVAALAALPPLVPFAGYFGALFIAEATVPVLEISANQVLAALFTGSFACAWARRRVLTVDSPLLPWLVAVAGYFAIRAALGESAERGPVHARYVVIYLAIAIMLAKCLRSERAAMALAWIVALTGAAAAAHGLLEAVERDLLSSFTGSWINAVRVKGAAKNSVVFGWNLVFGFPFAFLLFSRCRSPSARFAALGLGMFALAVATLTFNRQTFVLIAMVAGLCAALYTYTGRPALLGAMAVAGALGAATVLPAVVARLATVANLSRDLSYLEHRDSALLGLEMFARHPWFGVGLGSFPDVWKDYIPADYPTFFVQYYGPRTPKFPDMGYLGLLAESGLVGLALFIGTLGFVGWRAWDIRRAARAAGDAFAANYASMVLTLAIYVGVTTGTQDTFLYPRVWMVWGLALVLDRRTLGLQRGGDYADEAGG